MTRILATYLLDDVVVNTMMDEVTINLFSTKLLNNLELFEK